MTTIVTGIGAIAGGLGWFAGFGLLFWLGVGVCGVVLFLNLFSGAMKLPVLPTIFMAVGAFWSAHWYAGVAVGLVLWTSVEFLGELYAIVQARLSSSDA